MSNWCYIQTLVRATGKQIASGVCVSERTIRFWLYSTTRTFKAGAMEQVSVCYVCFLCQVPDALRFLINWDGYFWVLAIENAGSNPVNDSLWTLLHNAKLLTETAAFHFHSKPASLKTALWFYVFKWPQLANSDWILMNCAGCFEWWDKYELLSPKNANMNPIISRPLIVATLMGMLQL